MHVSAPFFRAAAPCPTSTLRPGHKGSYAGALDQTNAPGGVGGGGEGGRAEPVGLFDFAQLPCLLYAPCFHFFRSIFIRTFLLFWDLIIFFLSIL